MSEQEALVNQLNMLATRDAVTRNGLMVMGELEHFSIIRGTGIRIDFGKNFKIQKRLGIFFEFFVKLTSRIRAKLEKLKNNYFEKII